MKRITITFGDDAVKRIDEYRASTRPILSFTKAVNALLTQNHQIFNGAHK